MIAIVAVLVVALGIVKGRNASVAEATSPLATPSLPATVGEPPSSPVPAEVPAVVTVVVTETVISTVTEVATQTVMGTVTAPAQAPGTPLLPLPAETSAPSGTPYYENCAAVTAAGKAPLKSTDPGYRPGLDHGGIKGLACEPPG